MQELSAVLLCLPEYCKERFRGESASCWTDIRLSAGTAACTTVRGVRRVAATSQSNSSLVSNDIMIILIMVVRFW